MPRSEKFWPQTRSLRSRLVAALGKWAWIGVAGVVGVVSSCGVRPGDVSQAVGDAARGVPNPFAPASLIIHPLTRLEQGADQPDAIICHLEFKDAWGDACKVLGKVRVELFHPTEENARVGRQAFTWESDLSDLEVNARQYDQATRTYRLALGGLESDLVPTGKGPRALRLRATFDGWDPHGKAMRLAAEYLLNR